MEKINHGLLWSNKSADGTIVIGFTKKCIEEKLTECFHVLPAETKEVREKGPLLVLETNDGLQSIKAPFAGKVSYFNPKARNFPDRLKESETIVTLIPPGVAPPVKAKTVKLKGSEAFYVNTPFVQYTDTGRTATTETVTVPASEGLSQRIRDLQATVQAENARREREARLQREMQALGIQMGPNPTVRTNGGTR